MLIIGGSFSGLAAGRDLGSHYLVTIIDAKDCEVGRHNLDNLLMWPGFQKIHELNYNDSHVFSRCRSR